MKSVRKSGSSNVGRALAIAGGLAVIGIVSFNAHGTFAHGNDHYAKIRAVRKAGIPSLPTKITAVGGDGIVLITWSPVPKDGHYTLIQVAGHNVEMSKQKYWCVSWPDGGQTLDIDHAVSNGSPMTYVMLSRDDKTLSTRSKPFVATPQVQPGHWSIYYTPKVGTSKMGEAPNGVQAQASSTSDTLSVSSEINGIVKGKPKSGKAQAVRGGFWTATWHPSSPGKWPTLLWLDRETDANYIVDCTRASGKAKLASSDGTINIIAPDPAKPYSSDSGFLSKEKWDTSDPTRPIDIVYNTHDNFKLEEQAVVPPAKNSKKPADNAVKVPAAKSPVKAPVKKPATNWRRWLTKKTSAKTYYTNAYLRKHFASPSAIVFKIPVGSIDMTSSVTASSAASQTSVVTASCTVKDTLDGH